MSAIHLTRVSLNDQPPQRDLVKITQTKHELGVSPNTVRSLFHRGLAHYRLGKLVLVSRSEFEAFVKSGGAA